MFSSPGTESVNRPSAPAVFVQRLKIRNYKNIGNCDVALNLLTVLVGRNGAGKSNLLDALHFLADALQTSLDHALKSRGGLDEVRRRSTGHPRNMAIEIKMNLPECRHATYGFEIGSGPRGKFFVKQEHLWIVESDRRFLAAFRVENSQVIESSIENMPPAVSDRLYLVNAAGLPAFRGVYDALLTMGFYNLNPEGMKEPQIPDAGELLHRDGSNVSSVIGRLAVDNPKAMERIKSYLRSIIPGISGVERVTVGPRETLQFQQEVKGSVHPWRFYAANMSDGTLRALGAIVAVMQLAERRDPIRLVGIEEPETALHPAATGALMDALHEGTVHTQILVTTHSPDLLDHVNIESDGLLAVQSRQGNTEIGAIDGASLQAIRSHLYTPGELLRMDQLQADADDINRQEQMQMFQTTEDAT